MGAVLIHREEGRGRAAEQVRSKIRVKVEPGRESRGIQEERDSEKGSG